MKGRRGEAAANGGETIAESGFVIRVLKDWLGHSASSEKLLFTASFLVHTLTGLPANFYRL